MPIMLVNDMYKKKKTKPKRKQKKHDNVRIKRIVLDLHDVIVTI